MTCFACYYYPIPDFYRGYIMCIALLLCYFNNSLTWKRRDIKQSHQQEEKPDKQVEADQEEKDIPILKENQG